MLQFWNGCHRYKHRRRVYCRATAGVRAADDGAQWRSQVRSVDAAPVDCHAAVMLETVVSRRRHNDVPRR